MTLKLQKWNTTKDDFKQRIDKAIELIKDKEFISTPRVKFKFTEKQLREEFEFGDADELYSTFDNFYFNGDYIIYPKDKAILV